MSKQELQDDITALSNALIQADQQGDTEKATRYARAYRKAKQRLELIESNPAEYDIDSDEYKEKYSPEAGLSGFQKFRAGWGKAVSDLALGTQQIAADIAEALPASPFTAGAAAQAPELREEALRRRERDAGLNSGAGLAGQIAGNLVTLAPAGIGAGTLPRAAMLGAGEAALQPVANQSERAFNVAAGGVLGAAGQGAAMGLQRGIAPFARANSGRVDDAVNLLAREGVDLDVAQRTGSTAAQRLRSSFGDNPLTATRQGEFTENQLRQFSRAVLRRIGVNSDEATPDVLRQATETIGREIDDAVSSTPILLDTQLASDIQQVQRLIPGTLRADDARPLLKNIQDIFRGTNQQSIISPSVFRDVRSALSKLRRSTPAAGELASDLEDALLDALQRSGGNREGLRNALARWRNWKIIENSISKDANKLISPARLSNTFNQIRNRAVALRHLGHPETVELARLAEAGRTVLPETIGNSGTFARALAGNAVLGAGAGAGALASGQDVGSATAIGLGAAALPMMLQRGMLSQGVVGNYLSGGANPALQNLSQNPVTQMLIRQALISGGQIGGT